MKRPYQNQFIYEWIEEAKKNFDVLSWQSLAFLYHNAFQNTRVFFVSHFISTGDVTHLMSTKIKQFGRCEYELRKKKKTHFCFSVM